MDSALSIKLTSEYGLSPIGIGHLNQLGVINEADLALLTEAEMVAAGIPLIPAKKIARDFHDANSQKADSGANVFNQLIEVEDKHFVEFFMAKGKAFTREAIWLDPSNEVSKITPDKLIVVRALCGRDPFTDAVTARLLTGKTDHDEIRLIRLFHLDNDGFIAGLKELAAESAGLGGEAQELMALFGSFVALGDLVRYSWNEESK